MSRYDPLRWHLAKVPTDQHEVRMSFRDLEHLVGSLPPSARDYRPWWANSARMPQALAWQGAGFVVHEVNLTAELVVFVRGQTQRRAAAPAASTRVTDGRPEVLPQSQPASETEAAIQARLVTYLTANGWQIQRVADTASREHGIDVLATKDGRTLAVEVKGYPSQDYADPHRAGERQPTNPATQARHWFAAALLKAMLIRDEHPTYQVAIAFPDRPVYRSLQARVAGSLTTLPVGIFLLGAGDIVTELGTQEH